MPPSTARATITFCGAARGVTGSCYYLDAGSARIVVDCGVFQGNAGGEGQSPDAMNRSPFPFDPAQVDAVVLTHGHLDHVGRLPLLGRAGFKGQVFGHPATLEIARLIMEDTARLGLFSGKDPLYGDEDVERVLARTLPLRYGEEATVAGDVKVRLYDAGHILGSSSVRLAWGDKAVLFSGDLGSRGTPILRDPHSAWDAERDGVNAVITESTYGNRVHPGRDEARQTFRNAVLRAVSDGGKVLIPAFAVGRTQEVLYDLNVLVESGLLPNVPVIVDGPLGLETTALYQRHKDLYDNDALGRLRKGDVPLEFRDLYAAKQASASARIRDIPGAAIIIAGSGMCSGGRIMGHLKEYLPDKRTDVIFVGYQGAGTLGREIQDGRHEVDIDGERIPVRAAVTTISGFSAHADRDTLAEWLGAVKLRPDGTVFVTHGEEESSESYARLVGDRFKVRAVVPRRKDTVSLG
jgi:metallo-beta-lactamase family protein